MNSLSAAVSVSEAAKEKKARIINIQRFTVHDGPGIRTEIFFKGCPLRCEWCSNPESCESYPQIGVYPTSCIGTDKCGACQKVCPKSALLIESGKVIGIDRSICGNCLQCELVCPSGALKLWGEEITLYQALSAILADRTYYEKSGGGVTLSGGEALNQWEFCRDLLTACKTEGIHTCIESALHVPEEAVKAVLPVTDLFITDIKQMNTDIHKAFTGVGNKRILSNIRYIAKSEIPLIIRIPVIPGFNDREEAVDQIGDFIINELDGRVQQVQFLRFRPLGEEKNKALGLPNRMEGVNPERAVFEAHIKELAARLTDRGIHAIAGTTEVKKE